MQSYPKPKIYRSARYLDWLKTQPCVVCGKPNTVGHHIRKVQWGSGTGIKSHDLCSLPLCDYCHPSEHSSGLLKELINIENAIIEHFGGQVPLKWTCTFEELLNVPRMTVTKAKSMWESLPTSPPAPAIGKVNKSSAVSRNFAEVRSADLDNLRKKLRRH